MRLKSVGLGLLIVVLIAPLTGCRGESEPPPMVPSSTTTPMRTVTPLVAASVTKDVLTLAPTMTPTWTAVPTRTPKPTRVPSSTQTPTVLPTATQAPTPTPFPKVDLPIGALAFISYDRQLLIRDPAGEICVLAGDGIANSPAWSPDGTRLAFSYQVDDKAAAELRIYDLQTGDQTTVWTDPDLAPPYADAIREIAWSPSGRYLAFSQGCCPLGPVSIWDLEAAALAGYRGAYRMFWKLDEDVLTLSIPQPVGEFIPIGSGDSTSIALARPYEVSPTVILTGTAETLYDPRAWLSSDELVYMRLDLGDKERENERTWWTVRIVDGEAVDHHQLDAPPIRHDNGPLQEYLLPWLPSVTVGDYAWSADGAWVVFSANQDRDDPWRIYAFHWEEERLVGPFAEGFDLALTPMRTSWHCPE
jgi:WD40 repeat protein